MMFNTRYIEHLEREINAKDARIRHLESRLDELVDAKVFNRLPERLVKEVEKKESADSVSSVPSDAYSVAMEDAWKKSKAKTIEEENG